jgi:CRP-like cAMP-binding protein
VLDIERGGTCNRILQQLSDDDFGLLSEHLTPVELPVRRKLESSNRDIDTVYFFDSGVASIVANGPPDCRICVGLIGAEGATGLPVMMGTDRSPNETVIQFAGEARRIATRDLQSAMSQSASLHTSLLQYCHAATNQIAQTALTNGWNTIEQRLARWLCMVHDRSDSDELDVTHERLGDLLGVRRPAITLSLARLEQDRSIQVRRGTIAIVDRLRLEEKSAGMYGFSEREFERVFAPESVSASSRPIRLRAVLDLDYYNTARAASQQRVDKADEICARQRALVARLEERAGASSLQARALLAVMESSRDLMQKQLRRIERAIDLERARER